MKNNQLYTMFKDGSAQVTSLLSRYDEVLLSGRGEICFNCFFLPMFNRVTLRLRKIR